GCRARSRVEIRRGDGPSLTRTHVRTPRPHVRFEWGLITDIQPPDLETRIAILRKKAQNDGIHVGDPEVMTFIAGRVSTNIGELDDVAAHLGRSGSSALAKNTLADFKISFARRS